MLRNSCVLMWRKWVIQKYLRYWLKRWYSQQYLEVLVVYQKLCWPNKGEVTAEASWYIWGISSSIEYLIWCSFMSIMAMSDASILFRTPPIIEYSEFQSEMSESWIFHIFVTLITLKALSIHYSIIHFFCWLISSLSFTFLTLIFHLFLLRFWINTFIGDLKTLL